MVGVVNTYQDARKIIYSLEFKITSEFDLFSNIPGRYHIYYAGKGTCVVCIRLFYRQRLNAAMFLLGIGNTFVTPDVVEFVPFYRQAIPCFYSLKIEVIGGIQKLLAVTLGKQLVKNQYKKCCNEKSKHKAKVLLSCLI